MDTLYIINGQTVYSFCFSTRCKTTRTTSRVDVRLFTPSEVVLVVLHRVEKQKE